MKGFFQSFIRRAIPFSSPVDMEISLPEGVSSERITIRKKAIPLLLLLSVPAAALTALLIEILFLIMNGSNTYSGLPGTTRDHDEQDIWILLVPVLVVLLIAGILRYAGDKAKRVVRPFQSILSINAGIPLGFEGPIADAPFALAGEIKPGNSREKRVLAAAAITGGIAFMFGSPLAAIALAIEALIIELTWIDLTAVILGGATGILMHLGLIGTGPVFTMPQVPEASIWVLLGYTATGVLVGLIALLARKMVNGATMLFQQLPLDKLWWPVIAAVMTGIFGYFTPDILGAGYEHIDSLLLGQVTLQFLFVMVLGKLFLMSLAVGSGIPGGTMAPLLLVGGALGLFITFLLQFMFPAIQLNFAVAALVGMSAMFAGGNRVLPAAIFFAIETTRVSNAVVPVICACTASYLVVYLLTKKKAAQVTVLPEKRSVLNTVE